MGMESANYVFRPEASGADLDTVLRQHGARPAPEGRDGHFVLRDDDYWIDVQTRGPNFALSFRVALINPRAVLPQLRSLLAALMDVAGGQVFDVDGDLRLDELTDEAWSEVERHFLARQSEFQDFFGPVTAAVSADSVFDFITSIPDGAES